VLDEELKSVIHAGNDTRSWYSRRVRWVEYDVQPLT
jgi:hypothetical protein